MAVDFTPTVTVMGNYRISFGTVTASGVTSGACDTGLRRIAGGVVSFKSCTTNQTGVFYDFNTGSGATAINGMLRIVTATAGDDFDVFLIGD
jgi:hypothetical protein